MHWTVSYRTYMHGSTHYDSIYLLPVLFFGVVLLQLSQTQREAGIDRFQIATNKEKDNSLRHTPPVTIHYGW